MFKVTTVDTLISQQNGLSFTTVGFNQNVAQILTKFQNKGTNK